MALHTLDEFAKMCAVGTNYLSVQVSRKKVEVTIVGQKGGRWGQDKRIDDSIEKNAAYLAKMKRKAKKKEAEGDSEENIDEETEVTAAEIPAESRKKEDAKAKNDRKPLSSAITPDRAYELELAEQRLDIEIKTERARNEKIKSDKAEGLVIPTELVKALMLQDNKTLTIEIKNMLEDFITLMGAKYKASKEDITDLRRQSLEKLNIAIKNKAARMKASLKNIIDEYSETRGKGERD